jgi:hypothetical protein
MLTQSPKNCHRAQVVGYPRSALSGANLNFTNLNTAERKHVSAGRLGVAIGS